MKYKFWNGKETINGVSADQIKKSFGNKKLALFYNVEGQIERIEDIDILRSVYSLSKEEYPTDASVCEGYLAKLEEEKNSVSTELTLTDIALMIAELDEKVGA